MPRRFVLLLGLIFVLTACSESGDGSNDRSSSRGGGSPVSVEAVQADFGTLPLEERLSGVVRAVNQVAIYPEIEAPIVEVFAQDGDYVEEGQVLVQLRDTRFRQQVRQAEADLKIAQADLRSARADRKERRSRLQRIEKLAERDFESRQELERLQAEVESAEASVEQAEARVERVQATVEERKEDLAQTRIRAPISGVVGNREADAGMRADPSTQLFLLGRLDTVKVRVSISDRMMSRIDTGQTVRISAPTLPDSSIQAEVSRISPFLSSQSYSARAEIDVPNPDGIFRSGMFVTVDIAYGETDRATIVPKAALFENPSTGNRGIYSTPSLSATDERKRGDVPAEVPAPPNPDREQAERTPEAELSGPVTMQFREVNIVAEGREMVGIEGIDPGDWVVTVGQDLLFEARADEPEARVRPMSWERILSLQSLRDADMLEQFMEKQQRVAASRFGADEENTQE